MRHCGCEMQARQQADWCDEECEEVWWWRVCYRHFRLPGNGPPDAMPSPSQTGRLSGQTGDWSGRPSLVCQYTTLLHIFTSYDNKKRWYNQDGMVDTRNNPALSSGGPVWPVHKPAPHAALPPILHFTVGCGRDVSPVNRRPQKELEPSHHVPTQAADQHHHHHVLSPVSRSHSTSTFNWQSMFMNRFSESALPSPSSWPNCFC